jgi:hypothetical protein
MNATRIPVTSVSLDEAGVEEAREQLRARGGAAFTDADTEVMACGARKYSEVP